VYNFNHDNLEKKKVPGEIAFTLGIEKDEDIAERKEFLRKIGYKL
jgi:adenosine/AMP kinase